jgi:hypothetical protein
MVNLLENHEINIQLTFQAILGNSWVAFILDVECFFSYVFVILLNVKGAEGDLSLIDLYMASPFITLWGRVVI